jgi:uncharacterized protein
MAGTLAFHTIALVPVINGLKNLDAFLKKAEAHIKDQGHDPSDYLKAQLYSDMFNLIMQVQRATSATVLIATKANPENPAITLDGEDRTFPEVHDRISRTIKYLESIDPKSFEGREDVMLTMQFQNATVEVEYTVSTFITQFAHPNFWYVHCHLFCMFRCVLYEFRVSVFSRLAPKPSESLGG